MSDNQISLTEYANKYFNGDLIRARDVLKIPSNQDNNISVKDAPPAGFYNDKPEVGLDTFKKKSEAINAQRTEDLRTDPENRSVRKAELKKTISKNWDEGDYFGAALNWISLQLGNY